MYLDFATEYTQDRLEDCKPHPGYVGFKENEDVNDWLSQVLGKEVFIIRAPTDHHMNIT